MIQPQLTLWMRTPQRIYIFAVEAAVSDEVDSMPWPRVKQRKSFLKREKTAMH